MWLLRGKEIVLFAVVFLFCPGIQNASRAEVRVVSGSPGGIVFSYHANALRADTLRVSGKTYLQFRCDGHTTQGKPDTPSTLSQSVLFAVPVGGTPSITVSGLSRTILQNVVLAPNPHLSMDKSGFTKEIFQEDPVSYALSGFQPSEFVRLGTRYSVEGISVWELVFHPVLFDAHASAAAVSDSLTVTVSWNGSLLPVARAARIPEQVVNRDVCILSDSPRAPKPGAEIESPFSSGDWYRIAVTDSGMYSISGAELASRGVPLGTTPVSSLRMYYGGGRVLDTKPHALSTGDFREIAIKVRDIRGDGVLNAEDSIVFYGEALSRFIALPDSPAAVFQNHPYSSENVYWLTTSQSGEPKRMQRTDATLSDTLPIRTTFRELLHLEPEVALEYPESGILWYWDIIRGTSSKGYSFNAPGLAGGDSVRVRVSFLNPPIILNGSSYERTITHTMEIRVNETGPFPHSIPYTEVSGTEIRMPNTLREKGNILKIRRTTGNSDESVQLDWLELEYPRALEMNGPELEFFASGEGNPVQFVARNVSKESIEVYDTSDPYSVREITGKKYDAGLKTLTFVGTPSLARLSRFTVYDSGSYRKVFSLTRKNRSDLRSSRNGADHILISHRLFLDEARKLADWRSRDSAIDPLKSMVVDVEDIYNEFAWGVFDPTAIRDFLRFARESYLPRARYCCLVGDTTYKYKNTGPNQITRNRVPSFTYGAVTTDDFYTWDDITYSPRLAIGRICANTIEDARTVIGKIIEYERNPEKGNWKNQVLLMADDETGQAGVGAETEFTRSIEDFDISHYIPQYLERMKLMMVEYPMKNLEKPDATRALLDWFNSGCLIASYIGHGNKDLLAHEHLLVGARDIESLNNEGRLPLFMAASCSVGEFDSIEYLSLAEYLQLRKGGGCIAAIAASRPTYNSSNMELSQEFFHNLFDTRKNPEYRIGLALMHAKQNQYTQDIQNNNSNRYHIFGDPATRLAIPRFRFQTAPLDTLVRLRKETIAGSVTSKETPVPYNGIFHIRAEGPRVQKRYKLANGWTVDYTMPGKVFYHGEIPISGTGFGTSLVTPKDLTAEKSNLRIYLYAEGGAQDATGILDKLSVGEIDPAAPRDVTGPEIRLFFDGKVFKSDDYVRRQPTLSAVLRDPSGLNLYGARGHNLTLTLDGTEVFILTDKVRSIGGFDTGTVEYTLPLLSPGEHQLDINGYDSYNNNTKKTVMLKVIGSETGDVAIHDLLNYPNPMRTEGTTFTFNLNDDAGSAEIKIFSQSGRLVDTIRFGAGYGFNQVFWKPSRSIANGVYFYRLTVHSLNGRKSSQTEKLIVMQ